MNELDFRFHVYVGWTDSQGATHTQEAVVLMFENRILRLALSQELLPLQRCTIAVTDSDGLQCDFVGATIHHVRAREKCVHVTCELDETLGGASVQRLVDGGQLNRRHTDRRPVAIDACARSELNSTAMPIRVVDLSKGGCCLQSTVEVPVQHRIELFSWDEDVSARGVVVSVKWVRPIEEGFLLGCRFARADGYSSLVSLLAGPEADRGKLPGARSLLGRARSLASAGMSLLRGSPKPVQQS